MTKQKAKTVLMQTLAFKDSQATKAWVDALFQDYNRARILSVSDLHVKILDKSVEVYLAGLLVDEFDI